MLSLARESISQLFELAERECSTHPERAHRYVSVARTISMRTRTRIPRYLKVRFCRACHHYLIPGKNCRTRTRNGKVVITCLECGRVMRLPFVREQKRKRKGRKC